MKLKSMLQASLSVGQILAIWGTLLIGGTGQADLGPFITADEAHKIFSATEKKNVQWVFADSEKDFSKSHIPNSVVAYAHDLYYLDDVKKCKGLPQCEATAYTFIGKKLGIDANTEVIVYDSGIGVNASGAWFFLTLYGHKNVKILDGGLASWTAKQFPAESGEPKPPKAEKTFAGSVQWTMMIPREEVLKATTDSTHYLILDARHTIEEYTGKTLLSGLQGPGKESNVARGGFIPTAVFSPWTKYAGNKSGEPNKPTLKDPAELQKQLEKLKKNGFDPNKTVISYCHVGLGRGSFQYLALKSAGHNNVKLYLGSWHEWGNDPKLPLGKTE